LSEISSVWPPYTPYMDATPLVETLQITERTIKNAISNESKN
jgi:hypothetical protein